jgi:hypothetical protein
MKITCTQITSSGSLNRRITAAVLAAISLALLAGCGGGGGGGGGGSSSSNETFSGTVTDTASANGAAGFTVRFDSSGPSTTTSANGSFTLSVPSSDITGIDTIYVLDSNGFVVGSQAVSNDSGGATSIQVNVGPPPAPPLAVKARG